MESNRANGVLLYQAVVNETVFQFCGDDPDRPQSAGTHNYVRKGGKIHYALPVGGGQYVVGPVAYRETIIKDEGVSPEKMIWRNANIRQVGVAVDEDTVEGMTFRGDDRRLAVVAFALLMALGLLARWVYLLQ